jgi:DNA-binding MarR family transcriptional regulator
MAASPDVHDVASQLQVSLGLLVRRLRATANPGGVTFPETSALARLDRGGPTTAGELAKLEQISPQSMGATIAALESRKLVVRKADPADGRRSLLSITAAGRQILNDRRSARADTLADALSREFTPAELESFRAITPLIERLAHSF